MTGPGQTVAVTGATGFVGRYLCDALLANGAQVLALGRGDGPADRDRLTYRQTDYSAASLANALGGATHLVHLAGRRMTRDDAPMDLGPFVDPNLLAVGTLTDAAADAGVGRIVFASTIAVYSAACPAPYAEDGPVQPINAYALSKLAAEQYLAMKSRANELTAISLRFAAIYGYGEKGTPALMKFAGQANRGEPITLAGDPSYAIDQLYIRDAVSACIAALSPDVPAGCYNIGGGVSNRIADIAQIATEVFESSAAIDSSACTDPANQLRHMDISRAAEALNWAPAHDLSAGLTDFRRTAAQTRS